ncbi:carboxypeptidase-like regulatory domain-containing protein [Luteimicrobium subarcticum]|uniref:Carboxypeptidase family protein n=1 Tax=Luteimicrobium subarcticum TaxID=620910 RepID=A0A2M8WVL1_9MICO|nr:carboxypeptidase-like regulatory domain-containing protein [Luteimicrobium subarcticum]PJI94936.1 hypothetical protein CLV34_0784 [Luteimicrobium subarcticum]
MSRSYSPDEPLDADDERILAEIGRLALLVDPVPVDLADRSLFAMTLAALETEVMTLELVPEPTGVRAETAPTQARTITFTSTSRTVMITVAPGIDGVRIDGWIAPTGEVDIELHRPHGEVLTTRTDDDGRFAFDAVAPGPASLVARPEDGPAVSTPVIEL